MKKVVIVSGVSGSGKSIALQALEDLGFYCIDNLPIGMLPAFITQMAQLSSSGYGEVAVGVDVRNLGTDIGQFLEALDSIKSRGVAYEMVFLDADTEVLLKRFNETRRRHPLTKTNIPLIEAMKLERALLQPVRERAELLIDTSRTTIHQLRELIRDRVKQHATQTLSLLFLSFGFKHGLPRDADFVFDVRSLPNPHWDPALRAKTGKEPEVAAFLESHSGVALMLNDVRAFLERWLPGFEAENRSYMTVAIGCTGGQHRSVYLAEALTEHFRAQRGHVLVRHRELP